MDYSDASDELVEELMEFAQECGMSKKQTLLFGAIIFSIWELGYLGKDYRPHIKPENAVPNDVFVDLYNRGFAARTRKEEESTH